MDDIKKRKAEIKILKEAKLLKKLEKRQKIENISNSNTIDAETSKGRAWTISIAVPGSILDNAQSWELRTYLAGQIARAAAIFNIDEIIVYDDTNTLSKSSSDIVLESQSQCCTQMIHILQYLECPQYLRKSFFPKHNNLQYAGLLNPLDTPHHMRLDKICEFREGIVTNKPTKGDKGSLVNAGLLNDVHISQKLLPNTRVTVQFQPYPQPKMKRGIAVSPRLPCSHSGIYWGYKTRLASSLTQVLKESSFDGGYDITIGTSENGESIDNLILTNFRHLLIVFGGLSGLETCIDSDNLIEDQNPLKVFNHYVNSCPNQGSGTIRTEEAILVTLSALRPIILKSV